MSSLQFSLMGAAALLLFWAVGAHNRLMQLRNAILRRFPRYDEAFQTRHRLLLLQLDATETQPGAPAVAGWSEACANLGAAAAQSWRACEAVRARPGSAGAVASLRLAEEILQATRARLADLEQTPAPVSAPSGTEPPDSATRSGHDLSWLASENNLQFARAQFNAAVMEYNHAVRQFPAAALAGLMGFRTAGLL